MRVWHVIGYEHEPGPAYLGEVVAKSKCGALRVLAREWGTDYLRGLGGEVQLAFFDADTHELVDIPDQRYPSALEYGPEFAGLEDEETEAFKRWREENISGEPVEYIVHDGWQLLAVVKVK